MPNEYEITRLLDGKYKLRCLGRSELVLGPFSQNEVEVFFAESTSKSRLDTAFKKLDRPGALVVIETDLETA